MSKEQLERNQISVYAAGLLVGAAFGLGLPSSAPFFEALIYPVLGVVLYATFLQVPFRELRGAFAHGRYPAVVVTQTLVEIAGLLVYVRLVPSVMLPGKVSSTTGSANDEEGGRSPTCSWLC